MSALSLNLDYLTFAGLSLLAFAGIHAFLCRRNSRVRPGAWVALAVILAGGWWRVEEAGNRERRRLESMIGGMAPTYAEELQRMGHAGITLATPEDDPVYLAMIETQRRWLRSNPAAHDIYTMRKLPDGRNVLIVDSETDYDGDGAFTGEAEGRTPVGEAFPEEDAGLERAFRGEANFDPVPVTDRWGTWVSAWTPLLDDKGRVEAVLGVDFSAREWVTGIAAVRLGRIVQAAVLVLLVGGFTIVNGLLYADIERRRRIEAELRRSEGRLALRAAQTPLAVIEWDLSFRVVEWNAAAERLFGIPRAEALGQALLPRIAPETVQRQFAELRDGTASESHRTPPVEAPYGREGHTAMLEWFNASLVDEGRVIGITSLCEDVTEHRRLEEQLRQSQKMEAFGQLSGGIAHDFNNMLCVIQGLTEVLLARPDLPAEAAGDLRQIAASTERAADLTRQLLTFSRRRVFNPKDQDLNVIVHQTTHMLRRVLGDDVSLDTDFAAGLPDIHADTAMIEQALVNLTVNARDAMPKGGRLVISTSSRHFTVEETAPHEGAGAGPHVCLQVSDSGCGIPPEHLPRIFDPFFTTKEVGRGTGLGLATVFGIVQQHHGWIDVESTPGVGTTFRLFFPAVAESVPLPAAEPETRPLRGGHETILLVEDEPPLREFVTRMLELNGYHVIAAGSGPEALDAWQHRAEPIEMLLTDMIMPGGISGADLGLQLSAQDSALQVIYTSGYSTDFISRKVNLEPGVNFLQKPYNSRDLIRTVRESLDRRAPAGASLS